MKKELDTLVQETLERLGRVTDSQALERLRIEVLGRKGVISQLFKKLGDLPAQERPEVGKALNETRTRLESAFEEAEDHIVSDTPQASDLDISLPGRLPYLGHLHPITLVSMEITEIFRGLGFDVVEGPDVELDYYNFEALNIPMIILPVTCKIHFT